jgi:hypothetical protein
MKAEEVNNCNKPAMTHVPNEVGHRSLTDEVVTTTKHIFCTAKHPTSSAALGGHRSACHAGRPSSSSSVWPGPQPLSLYRMASTCLAAAADSASSQASCKCEQWFSNVSRARCNYTSASMFDVNLLGCSSRLSLQPGILQAQPQADVNFYFFVS